MTATAAPETISGRTLHIHRYDLAEND